MSLKKKLINKLSQRPEIETSQLQYGSISLLAVLENGSTFLLAVPFSPLMNVQGTEPCSSCKSHSLQSAIQLICQWKQAVT